MSLSRSITSSFSPSFRIPLLCYSSLALTDRLTVNIKPSGRFDLEHSFWFIIDTSTCKGHLHQIHAQIFFLGLQLNSYIVTKLVNSFTDICEIGYARRLFDGMPKPDVFLWNALFRGYSRKNFFKDAIEMYLRMQVSGVRPDGFTFPCVLKACGELEVVDVGRIIHGQTFRLGFALDVFVQNGVVTMYSRCREIEIARHVFDGLPDKTLVTWTSIISGYVQNGKPVESLRVFVQMRQQNVKPDCIVLVSVTKAYSDIEDLKQGSTIHGFAIKTGLEYESDLRVSLTALYAKCGQLTVARSLFDEMELHDVILWNAMISGYAKNGYAEEAVHLFKKMIGKNIRIDYVTACSSVLACAQVGSVDLAKWMHEIIGRSEHRDDIFVNTGLIDMFAKCGLMDLASALFDQMQHKDVVVWSAMIAGYGLHGEGEEAITIFHAMRRAGVCPNDVTFLGLLTACNHSGLVEEGWYFYHCMSEFGIVPRHQHCACVVDLLGRAGCLDKAYHFIRRMPFEPGVTVWGALLSACKIHRHVALGEYAAHRLLSLDPLNIGHYVQLSNLYASLHMWNHVSNVRTLIRDKGLTKDLGYSLVEVNGKLQSFKVGDMSHPKSKEILEELESLEMKLNQAGFIHHTESILHDVVFEEKVADLCNHSERFAIAYGLISTSHGTTLRITKNLRSCVNCHSAIKLISKLVNREIVVRDSKRFHFFKDGFCSCGDYW